MQIVVWCKENISVYNIKDSGVCRKFSSVVKEKSWNHLLATTEENVEEKRKRKNKNHNDKSQPSTKRKDTRDLCDNETADENDNEENQEIEIDEDTDKDDSSDDDLILNEVRGSDFSDDQGVVYVPSLRVVRRNGKIDGRWKDNFSVDTTWGKLLIWG